MAKQLFSTLLCLALMSIGINAAHADDDAFVPAYQNTAKHEKVDYEKYITHKDGRLYYTSGKKNGIRVNENNEESTDETVGILTFLIAPAGLIYMNIFGFWE